MQAGLILLVIIAVFAILLAAKTVRIVPQARAASSSALAATSARCRPGWRSSCRSSTASAR